MDYKILEVHPDQILVEFINGKLATVIVEADWTPREVDHAVSFEDPEYQVPVEELINRNISVGETRTSKRIGISEQDEFLEEDSFVPEVDGTTPNYAIELTVDDLLRARYYAAQGDNRLWDAVDAFLVDTVDPSETDGGIDAWIEHVGKVAATRKHVAEKYEEENNASLDVFEQAMKELENE